jgi:YVTN family beta-propeller protein
MDWLMLALLAHLVGIVFGVGGATVSDALFLRTIKGRKISTDALNLMSQASKVIWTGLAILILSGTWMITMQYLNTGSFGYFSMSSFQAKFTIVPIIILNGIVFHTFLFPFMRKAADKSIQTKEFASKLWLFALSGGISVTSWWSVVILGFVKPALPYWLIMNIYIVLVFFAVIFGYFMLSYTIFFSKKREVKVKEKKAKRKNPAVKKYLVVGSIAALLLLAFAGAAAFYPKGKTHEVCINEAPPWFGPEVLEIKVGDTVVWKHCDDVEPGKMIPALSNFIIPFVTAHDGSERAHVHTHPILAISGPEKFSSNFGPVGHKEDGKEFKFKFTKEGIYTYICPTHPYMKGVIAVGVKYDGKPLWPPEEIIKPSLLPPPSIPGIGEIWVNTQFEEIEGQDFPGTITVIDAATWEIKKVISHERFNNPHNLWHSYDMRHVFQTQWHSDEFSKIDINTKEVVKTVSLGNAPAHVFVHPRKDRIYVTINNENKVIILNSNLDKLGEIITSFGPHGIWISPDGKWMSVAATLQERLDIIDLETEKVVKTFEAEGLPLATAITYDGKYAMISLLLEGKVRFIDLETMAHVKDVGVGTMPIWPSPAPDGKHVFVPNTGSADISVISLDTLEVVKTIPAAGGAHGIIFGPKEGGGYYGYLSSKFARVVGVIDAENMEMAGYLQLGENQWGGNGIIVLPAAYDEHIR